MSSDTRESLALELADERYSAAEEEAYQGGLGLEFKRTTTIEDFMGEALAFVDRCFAAAAHEPT